MRYVATHPRKVRGGQIHQPQDEKVKEAKKRYREVKDSTFLRGNAPPSFNEEKCHLMTRNNSSTDAERKTVEATYLVPEIEHFIETSSVKNLSSRIKLWLDSDYPVHLIGPTGCGKTSLAMHVATQIGRPVVWLNGDESVTTTDLVGGYSQVETETVRDKYVHNVFKSKDILRADWVDNPLTVACKYGYTLIYNEFSRTKPAANNVLLSVFEEGILELPTKFGEDRYVKVHPNFKAILTSNPIEYAGVYRPQDALLDRMVGIHMDYYDFEVETKIVREHTGMPMDKTKIIVSVVRSLREKLPDAQKPGTRACIMIAQGLKTLNGHGNVTLEDLCIDVIGTKTGSLSDLAKMKRLVKDTLVDLT